MPTGPGLSNNYTCTNQRTQNNHATDVRIDHRFSNQDSVFTRYSFNKADTMTPSLCPPVDIGGRSIDPTCIVGGAATGNLPAPTTRPHTTWWAAGFACSARR